MEDLSSVIERWLPVVGFEGFYEVSNLGRVRSLDRMVYNPHCDQTSLRPGRVLKAYANKQTAHQRVSLCVAGERTCCLVHVLVLTAFVGPCPDNHESCHRDDDPENNVDTNLYWGTRADNMRDRSRNGKHHMQKRTHCPYGHALRAPNLSPQALKNNHRECLACEKTRYTVHWAKKRGNPYDRQAISDRYYQAIMGSTNELAAGSD